MCSLLQIMVNSRVQSLLIKLKLLILLIVICFIQAICLPKNAVLWFSSYLHSRKQCVVLHGNTSDLLIQQRGVPQGSTLGPLLFSIYVIYTSKPDLPQIEAFLLSDFNILQDGLSHKKLLLNITNSYIMTFDTRQKLRSKSRSCLITCNDSTSLHKVNNTKERSISSLGMLNMPYLITL